MVGNRRLRIGACLSLSGRHARFGRQAANGLETWRSLDDLADLIIADDGSDPDTLKAAMRDVSSRCDILMGPYSTNLMRTAGNVAVELDRLIWNHGGSGDDVESAHPGHIVSVLTPTSRYAEPFLRYLRRDAEPARLWLVCGKGSFGRQIASGAAAAARTFGVELVSLDPGDPLPSAPPADWSLFCAGSFEEDVQTVRHALNLPEPPRDICAVAAGVREFGEAVESPEGIFGVGQWAPHPGHRGELGPTEAAFLTAYENRVGSLPDYPAVQAAATAVIAVHCANLAGGTSRDLLWSVASPLNVTTLFGAFRIDPLNGSQIGHEMTLVRWTLDGQVAVCPGSP